MRKKIVISHAAMFLFGMPLPSHFNEIVDLRTNVTAVTWSYQGKTGPEHWGELSKENATCVQGKEQSPINIEFSKVQVVQQRKIEVNYTPTPFSVTNTGHTLQAKSTSPYNTVIVDGIPYQLVQFHFHTPSEHTFNGKGYDMELHLVHKSKEKHIAVIGIMLQEGRENKELALLWDIGRKEKTLQADHAASLIDVTKFLPKNGNVFRYNGSFTVPPCTEGVKWIVSEQPIELSREQIQAFQEMFGHNRRPVQPLHGRKVIQTSVVE